MNKHSIYIGVIGVAIILFTYLSFNLTPNSTVLNHADIAEEQVDKQDDNKRPLIQETLSNPFLPEKLQTNSDKDSRRVEELSQQVESLSQKLEQTTDVLSTAENRPLINATLDKVPEETLGEDLIEKQVSLLEHSFNSEQYDPAWSDSGQVLIETQFKEVEMLNQQDISCMSTICRVAGQISESMEVPELYRNISQHSKWEGETYISFNETTGDFKAYFAKPGTRLPRYKTTSNQ